MTTHVDDWPTMLSLLPTADVWIGLVGGVVGTALGLFNFFDARRREQEAKRTEEADWQRWVDFVQAQVNNPAQLAFEPSSGSSAHKWAERMVARGMLRREMRGRGYTIRGGE